MRLWLKVYVAKPKDLISIPGTHMVEKQISSYELTSELYT